MKEANLTGLVTDQDEKRKALLEPLTEAEFADQKSRLLA